VAELVDRLPGVAAPHVNPSRVSQNMRRSARQRAQRETITGNLRVKLGADRHHGIDARVSRRWICADCAARVYVAGEIVRFFSCQSLMPPSRPLRLLTIVTFGGSLISMYLVLPPPI